MTKPRLEIIRGAKPAKKIRAAVFDFDDTLSLLRSGWQSVMLDQAMEVLEPLVDNGDGDFDDKWELLAYIEEYIDELTGKPTIEQMKRLAEGVAAHGGSPLSAEEYKSDYLARLGRVIDDRAKSIRSGAAPETSMQVPSAENLVQSLSRRGVTLIVASGTDDVFVQSEMRLLKLDHYFSPHIYGAPADDPTFSKGRVLDKMIRELELEGGEIVGFGDGVVEIRETRRVGGFAIGIAKWAANHQEDFRRHRLRLIEAGAQAIIPDYEGLDDILRLLDLGPETAQC